MSLRKLVNCVTSLPGKQDFSLDARSIESLLESLLYMPVLVGLRGLFLRSLAAFSLSKGFFLCLQCSRLRSFVCIRFILSFFNGYSRA